MKRDKVKRVVDGHVYVTVNVTVYSHCDAALSTLHRDDNGRLVFNKEAKRKRKSLRREINSYLAAVEQDIEFLFNQPDQA